MTRSMHAQRPCAAASAAAAVADRVAALDWAAMAARPRCSGCALTGPLLDAQECAALAAAYPSDDLFRSRVIMARHGFGRGEYKYFAYPLPETIAALRTALYPPLAEIANRWNEAMGIEVRYPREHAALSRALPRGRSDQADAAAPAIRPGRLQLPASGPLWRARLPAAGRRCCCREPGEDFAGGEFVLTEQRPRMQSRAEVVPLAPRRGRDLSGPPSAGAGHARHLSRQHAARREPAALGPPAHARASFSTTRSEMANGE